MKKAPSRRGPSGRSLLDLPEIDFAAYRIRRNPFAERIGREGIEIVWAGTTRRRPLSEEGPSKASLREMPEVDVSQAKSRRNPYARRIASQGITLQIGRGRPRQGTEVGPTIPKSIRLPEKVWELLAQRAKEEGIPLHAALRAAVLDWLNRVA